jgi:hydroxymethylglutaryl-CoA lyase
VVAPAEKGIFPSPEALTPESASGNPPLAAYNAYFSTIPLDSQVVEHVMNGDNLFPKQVTIFEVGPRDGLQNEPDFIPTDKKIELVDRLTAAGCSKIEVTSFVHPKWVPQLRDAREVLDSIVRADGVTYSALVPNLKGLELAADAGVEEVVTIMSASESHNHSNLNRSVAESLADTEAINKAAAPLGIRVRSYIATSFGCPMEGDIPPEKVARIAAELEQFGSYEISLGDTTGMANPRQVGAVIALVRAHLDLASLAVHFHRSDGIEFANVLAALQAGVTTFDGAAGGLGGCPYAPGATGNAATEGLVEMFTRMDLATGIDREKIKEAAAFARSLSAYESDRPSAD